MMEIVGWKGSPMQSVPTLGRSLTALVLTVVLMGCSPEKPLTRAEQAKVNEARYVARAMFSFRDRDEDLRDWHHEQLEKLYRVYTNQSSSGELWWTAYSKKTMNGIHNRTGIITKYKLVKASTYDAIFAENARMMGNWVVLIYEVSGSKGDAVETVKLWKISPSEDNASRISALNQNTYRIIKHYN
jgi:hypothetical protein